MSIRLYVGNLPKSDVEREQLETVFADAGDLVSVKVIKDRKTGKCRGFGFVTVETDEQADQIIEKYNGAMFLELPIKIEKALPKAKGQEDDDENGEASEPKEPKEPSSVPKPNLSNKGSSTNTSTSTARRSSGSGAKKGGRKEGAKSTSSSTTYTSTSTSTESFQPDPRWAGKLAELKDKLAESGNL
jgi:RNA recognition motif-containing protein